jgi:hypothetical protein
MRRQKMKKKTRRTTRLRTDQLISPHHPRAAVTPSPSLLNENESDLSTIGAATIPTSREFVFVSRRHPESLVFFALMTSHPSLSYRLKMARKPIVYALCTFLKLLSTPER